MKRKRTSRPAMRRLAGRSAGPTRARPAYLPEAGRSGLRRAQSSRGLSLVELLVALVITALIGSAVAAMLLSASSGTSVQAETRGFLLTQASIATRLGSTIRSSKMVLACGADYLVLWTTELNPDGMPNLSELRRIERDAATGQVRCYRAPDDLPAEQDTAYDLGTTDFEAVTRALRGTPNFLAELWSPDVTAWMVWLDKPQVQQARYVGYRLTVTRNGASETAVGGAALRNL